MTPLGSSARHNTRSIRLLQAKRGDPLISARRSRFWMTSTSRQPYDASEGVQHQAAEKSTGYGYLIQASLSLPCRVSEASVSPSSLVSMEQSRNPFRSLCVPKTSVGAPRKLEDAVKSDHVTMTNSTFTSRDKPGTQTGDSSRSTRLAFGLRA